MVKPWPETLTELSRLGPYPSMGRLAQEASRLRGQPTTGDAVRGACNRHGATWSPSDLVRAVASEWDDIPTEPGATTSHVLALPQAPPRLTLFPGDIHCPIWDRDLVFAVLAFAEEWRVDHLCIGGDLLDLYGASRFSKEGRRLMEGHGALASELRALTGFYQEADRIFDRVDYLLGNHEGRAAERFVNENLWLYDHGALDPRSLFEVPEKWRLHDVGSRLRVGSVCFEHGEKLKGSGAKYSAENVLRWNPYQHTVYGHTHRLQQAFHTVYDERGLPVTYSATSAGHLSQLDYHKDYATQPNWCHGFVLVEHGEHPQVHTIKIQDRRWRFGGREYGV